MIENLGIKLAGGSDSPVLVSRFLQVSARERGLHDIAVNDLRHTCDTLICHEIEGLCLDTRALHGYPFEMF